MSACTGCASCRCVPAPVSVRQIRLHMLQFANRSTKSPVDPMSVKDAILQGQGSHGEHSKSVSHLFLPRCITHADGAMPHIESLKVFKAEVSSFGRLEEEVNYQLKQSRLNPITPLRENALRPLLNYFINVSFSFPSLLLLSCHKISLLHS